MIRPGPDAHFLVMIGFGVLGYVFRKLDLSLVPIVLGLLLGTDMENNLRRALSISGGDFGILVASPIAIGLYVVTALFLCLAVWLSVRKPSSPL